MFEKELRMIMYGSGDSLHPRAETVEIVEKLTLQYLETLCEAAFKAVSVKGKGTVKLEDLMFVLRKDPKKKARAEELIFRFDELAKARKIFEATE